MKRSSWDASAGGGASRDAGKALAISQLKASGAAILLLLALGACVKADVKYTEHEASPALNPPAATAFATVEPRGAFPDGIAVTGPRNAIASVPPLYYEAGLRFAKVDSTAEVGKMRLQPYVHISNNSLHESAEIHLSGCSISLRMYPEPYRDEPPVWDGAGFRERAGRCRQKDFVVAIEPGASYEATDEIDPADLFDDSVPDGQYRFSVVFTHVDRPPMQLGVWNAFVTRGPGGLAFTAETRIVDVAPRRLEVVVTLTNVSDKTLRFEHSACAVWLKAHSRSDRAGTPVWDELKRPNPDPKTGILRVCEDPLFTTELEPGESARPEEFHKVLAEPDVLEDLLPDGPYYFTATVEVNGAKFDLAAGRADLTRVQQPLPAARPVDGLRYEASPIAHPGSTDSLRSVVTITNVTDRPLESGYPARCPVSLSAFRDKLMRDMAFRGDEPDWYQKGPCLLDIQRQLLPPGGTITMEAEVAVSEIREGAGAGHYYFVAVVWGPASGRLPATAVVLSAGEADVPE